jgi:ligand-binding SRPBCC domain-containing protein
MLNFRIANKQKIKSFVDLTHFKKMVRIKKHSGIYTLETEQYLPISLEEAWAFFSTPNNLAKITPSHMGFKITSGKTDVMYPGQIISYQIGLLPGVKSSWVTEITHVTEERFFVDEQRFGPYSMWHHEHHFEADGEGTIMRDKVSYKIPFGMLGSLMHSLFIKAQLNKIFSYRYELLDKMFNLQAHDQERVI